MAYIQIVVLKTSGCKMMQVTIILTEVATTIIGDTEPKNYAQVTAAVGSVIRCQTKG
jgi:hypothetical protein